MLQNEGHLGMDRCHPSPNGHSREVQVAAAWEARYTCMGWSAANGGLRDGGLSKSEDILGKRPFSSVFWIFQLLFTPSGKEEKGRKRAKKADFGRFPGRAARHPLSPHLLEAPCSYTLWIGQNLDGGHFLDFWRGNPLKLRTLTVPTP